MKLENAYLMLGFSIDMKTGMPIGEINDELIKKHYDDIKERYEKTKKTSQNEEIKAEYDNKLNILGLCYNSIKSEGVRITYNERLKEQYDLEEKLKDPLGRLINNMGENPCDTIEETKPSNKGNKAYKVEETPVKHYKKSIVYKDELASIEMLSYVKFNNGFFMKETALAKYKLTIKNYDKSIEFYASLRDISNRDYRIALYKALLKKDKIGPQNYVGTIQENKNQKNKNQRYKIVPDSGEIDAIEFLNRKKEEEQLEEK